MLRQRVLPPVTLAGLDKDEARVIKAIFHLQRLDREAPISLYEITAIALMHEITVRKVTDRLVERGALRRKRFNGDPKASLFHYEVLNSCSTESGTICPK